MVSHAPQGQRFSWGGEGGGGWGVLAFKRNKLYYRAGLFGGEVESVGGKNTEVEPERRNTKARPPQSASRRTPHRTHYTTADFTSVQRGLAGTAPERISVLYFS